MWTLRIGLAVLFEEVQEPWPAGGSLSMGAGFETSEPLTPPVQALCLH